MTLLRANVFFVAANLLHTADHQRQGTGGLSWEILVGGSAISIAAIASLVLAWRRDWRAPVFGTVLGAVTLGGFILGRLHGRAEGWEIAMVLLLLFVLYSVAR